MTNSVFQDDRIFQIADKDDAFEVHVFDTGEFEFALYVENGYEDRARFDASRKDVQKLVDFLTSQLEKTET